MFLTCAVRRCYILIGNKLLVDKLRKLRRQERIGVNDDILRDHLLQEPAARQASWRTVREKLIREKSIKVLKANERSGVSTRGQLPLGTIVYRPLRTARNKTATRY